MRFWMTEYDSDNESVLSERLAPAKLRLTPPPSPKPEVTRRSSTASSSSQRSAVSGNSKESPPPIKEKLKNRRKRIKTIHNPGEATFFKHFAPNNPELLPSHSYSRSFDLGPPSEDETGDSDAAMDGSVKVSYPESVLSGTQPGNSPRDGIFGHRSSLSLGHYDYYSHDASRLSFRAHSNPRAIGVDTRYGSRSYEDYDTQKILSKESPGLPLNGRDSNSSFPDSAAVDGLLKLKGLPLRRASTSSETVATSPTLIPHLISPSHAAPDQTLAAMAPESPNGVAPEPLPPFSEVIGNSNRQRTSSYSNSGSPMATSPQDGSRMLPQPIYNPGQGGAPLTRTSTVSSCDAHSPSRHSPDVIPSPVDGGHHPHHHYHNHHQQQQPRRVGYRQGPIPSLPTYDPGSSNSSRSYSNSAGTSSGNEGLTPISSNNTSSERSMMYDSRLETNADHLSAKYVHYPGVPVAGYKCQFEGCDAPPFTTQYLLNSHANVHSSERPHFCSVKGCPRGEGGMGFKRKNEMIRHGLVHQSPGYLCPWCDREHRYPRPDNLQRHVSTHHKDKSRDDPKLLEVLAQRAPGGVTRGRRRRA